MKFSTLVVFILFILLILILAFIINNAVKQFKNYSGGNSEKIDASALSQKYYYSIYNGDMGLVYDELKQQLAQYNFHEEPLTKHVHVSFGSLSSKDIYGNDNAKQHIINGKLQWWDPLFLKQKAVIKNTLGGHKSLSYKIKLYETIKKLVPIGIKHIPKTYTINEFDSLFKVKQHLHNESDAYANGTYILKKNNMGKQKGVRVFSTKNEYFSIKKELDIKPHNGIIMEYITNPALTIDGKKFHLRVYVLLIIESGIKRCYIHDEFWILTAKEKYKKGDWLNPKIHITGATTTDRIYKFPDDIATQINHKKFNEFKKTLAFAIAFNNSIIYEENDIGYHIYGVDVLMTEDNNFFILELNGYGIGHGCVQGIKNTPECHIFEKRFSKDFFSFVLNSTVLPVFGLKRRPAPIAEVCSYGILSPFFNILTGSNRCTLIPYLDASDDEIESAKKIYFYNESIQLKQLLKICNLENLFLLEKERRQKKDIDEIESDQPRGSEGLRDMQLVGYLALDHNNYLTIAVMEEYQNRGIATAMIAQFLEIYAHRIKDSNDKIYMIKKNTFIDKIANRLKFVLNSNNVYVRTCRIKDKTINKVNNYQLLTYNYIKEDNGFNHDMLISQLNANMIATKSQFVHLVYGEISNSEQFKITKASTGSKYDKNFVLQGSELKSVLNVKNMHIKIYKDYVDDKSLYRTYEKYKPYLYNGYRIDMHLYFFLYVSKNGVKKCYYLNNNIIVKSDILFEDELEKNKNYAIYVKDSDMQYKWPDTFLHDDKIGDKGFSPLTPNEKNNSLQLYIGEITDSIINSEAMPYPESNSGFNLICATIDFTEKENKYVPQIRNLYTYMTLPRISKQYQDLFSRHYYDFLTNNIINPHFGLSNDNIIPIQPLKCIVNTELNISADIISKLYLKFNKSRNKIEIYYNNSKIGHIDLNIDNIDVIVLSHMELDSSYRKKNIAVNVLFVLMEILAAYYAPLNISLRMAFVKPMFQIAHTLQFHKAHWHSGRPSENEEEYYIRLCRI